MKLTIGKADPDGLLAAARAAVAAHRHRLERGDDLVTAVTRVTPKTNGGGDKIEGALASFLELHARRKIAPHRLARLSVSSTASSCRPGAAARSIASADVMSLS